MATINISNPFMHEEKTVDDRGRVYVSNSLKGKTVRVTVEVVEDD